MIRLEPQFTERSKKYYAEPPLPCSALEGSRMNFSGDFFSPTRTAPPNRTRRNNTGLTKTQSQTKSQNSNLLELIQVTLHGSNIELFSFKLDQLEPRFRSLATGSPARLLKGHFEMQIIKLALDAINQTHRIQLINNEYIIKYNTLNRKSVPF